MLLDRTRSLHAARLLLSFFALGLGCSGDSVSLPSFNDVTSAPAAIQRAARAVVLVRTADEVATGSFVSESGLLLTNNHVLGDTVCPLEGCYVQITWMYQRGEPRQQPQIVFAVPIAVNPGLDVATVQLFMSAGGPKLSTPDHLTFRAVDPGSLVGTHVTVVGHPEGALKKWTDGVVIDLDGSWFQSTAYVLPGESGSPALDDGGNIVGIIHRAPTGEDLISSDGVNVYSIGTPSGSIIAAMGRPLPAAMISTMTATTPSDFLEYDRVYLNARVSTVTVASGPAAVLSLLAQACDAGLAQQAYASPGDLDSALGPCYEAGWWIDCRVDATPVSYGVVCPSLADATAWANRYQSVNQCWRDMNGRLDLDSISFGIAGLSGSMSAGTAAGALSLQQALSKAQPPLDFELAYYLAAFGIPAYGGTDITGYVKNYQAVSHYEYQATFVAAAAAWLYSHGSLAKADAVGLLARLHDDPHVSVGSKLYVERLQYSMGAL